MDGKQIRTAEAVKGSLALPARLDAGTVAGVAADLRARAGLPLRLDGERVRHLGGLGLELLLRAERDWRSAGLAFSITPRSPDLEAALLDFGMDPGLFDGQETPCP